MTTVTQRDATGVWYGTDNYLSRNQQEFNAKCVLKYCRDISKLHWQTLPICAILGNMAFESTLNPQLNEKGGGTGYGLCQWTPKSDFIRVARSYGYGGSYDSMYAQLKVVDAESIKTYKWSPVSQYRMSFKEFAEDTTHSLEYLTKAWFMNFEKPRDQSSEAQQLRIDGDSDHIGSSEWLSIIDGGGITTDGSITDFVNWLLDIANDNSYLYKYNANHGVDWQNYLTYKYFDCSSFVSFGLKLGGGYDLQTQFATATQLDALKDLGFKPIKFQNTRQLRKGDIMLREGHTEVVSDAPTEFNVKLVGARTDELPPNQQISEHDFNGDWEWIIRPFDKHDEGSKKRRKPKPIIYNNRRANRKGVILNRKGVI